jgi:hypothetical protein
VEQRRLPQDSSLEADLAGFGTKVVELALPAGTQAVTMTVDGLDTAGALVPLQADGGAIDDGVVSDATGTTLRLTLPAGTARVLVALTDTPAQYDPTLKPFAARHVTAELAAELNDAGALDAGATEPDGGMPGSPREGGCGCRSVDASGAMLVAWVAATRLRARRRISGA